MRVRTKSAFAAGVWWGEWLGFISFAGVVGRHLNDNQLSGRLPVELGRLTALGELCVFPFSCMMCGGRKRWRRAVFVPLSSSSFFYLCVCVFVCVCVSAAGLTPMFSGVVGRRLENNQLSGWVPEDLGNLTKLYSLYTAYPVPWLLLWGC